MIENPKPNAEEVEAEETRKMPWWKRLSIAIAGATAFLGALTGFLTLVVPLFTTPSKAGPAPVPVPTAMVTYLVPPPVSTVTPVPFEQRRRGNKSFTATVTTPFGLYMRSGPSEKTNPLIKLEQNAQVKVSNCNKASVFIDEVEGQWCQATYKDDAGDFHRGWVFNAYLINDSEDS